MSIRVTLSTPSQGEIVAGGVVFTDGTAVLASLSANKRRFFEIIHATIEDVAVIDDAPRSLGDLTRDGLLQFADDQSPAIVVKRSANKADLLEQIRVELDERALEDQRQATVSRNEQILEQSAKALGLGQSDDTTVHVSADTEGNASAEQSADAAAAAHAAGNTATAPTNTQE